MKPRIGIVIQIFGVLLVYTPVATAVATNQLLTSHMLVRPYKYIGDTNSGLAITYLRALYLHCTTALGTPSAVQGSAVQCSAVVRTKKKAQCVPCS